MPARRFPLALAAALLVSGCINIVVPPSPAPVVPAASASARPTTSVTGRLLGLPGMVAAGGGNVIVDNAGNILAGPGGIVAAGGGNVVGNHGGGVVGNAGGNLVLLQAAEAPVADAWVQLADATGRPYTAIAPVKTDADGRFTVAGVPAGLGFVVQGHVTTAAGKRARLLSIVQPGDAGAATTLSAASTAVTAAVLEGHVGPIGQVDPARFEGAVRATADALAKAPWPDLADRDAVLGAMRALTGELAGVRTALDAVRAEISQLRGDVEALRAELEALRREASPGREATPAAAPVPASSPSPAPTQAPTPAPSPAAATERPSEAVLLASDGSSPHKAVAQAFELAAGRTIDRLAIAVRPPAAGAPGGVRVALHRAGYGGVPEGAPLAETTVPVAAGAQGTIEARFRAPVALEARTDYALVIEAQGGAFQLLIATWSDAAVYGALSRTATPVLASTWAGEFGKHVEIAFPE